MEGVRISYFVIHRRLFCSPLLESLPKCLHLCLSLLELQIERVVFTLPQSFRHVPDIVSHPCQSINTPSPPLSCYSISIPTRPLPNPKDSCPHGTRTQTYNILRVTSSYQSTDPPSPQTSLTLPLPFASPQPSSFPPSSSPDWPRALPSSSLAVRPGHVSLRSNSAEKCQEPPISLPS